MLLLAQKGRSIPIPLAARIVDELNIAMTWLDYPGRRNGVATAESVRFDAPPARG